MDTGHVVLNLIALLIIISALSGLCGLFAGFILARQRDQVRRRLIAPGLAYQRYIAGVSLLRLLLVALIVVCVIISANVVLLNSITPTDPFPANVRWYAAGLLPIVWVSLVIFSVSVETTTGSEALQLLGITATGQQILWFRLRTVLLSLPPLVLVESIAVLWLLNLPVWLLGIFVPLLLAVTLMSWSRRYRWLFRSRPIEETEWSALSPRIQAWARLAKFPYHKTRVTASQTIGVRDGNVGGLFHRTLYISDTLLRNTDWRQQDAFVAYLFAWNRRRRLMLTFSLGASLGFLSAALVGLVVISSLEVVAPAAAAIGAIGLVALVALLLLVRVLTFVRFYQGNNRLPFYCDRSAADLTGDPMAVMVLLHTINQITGGSLGVANPYYMRSGNTLLLQRMGQLDGFMRQPWPRAPWAYLPVPAMAPVYLGPMLLTIPYQPSAPAPVPSGRYPVSPPLVPSMPPTTLWPRAT